MPTPRIASAVPVCQITSAAFRRQNLREFRCHVRRRLPRLGQRYNLDLHVRQLFLQRLFEPRRIGGGRLRSRPAGSTSRFRRQRLVRFLALIAAATRGSAASACTRCAATAQASPGPAEATLAYAQTPISAPAMRLMPRLLRGRPATVSDVSPEPRPSTLLYHVISHATAIITSIPNTLISHLHPDRAGEFRGHEVTDEGQRRCRDRRSRASAVRTKSSA